MANVIQLIPIQEMAPGQVAAIRNEVKKALVVKASMELKMPPDLLVVRDIRPYDDLHWGTDDNAQDGLVATALTTNRWDFTTDATLAGWLSCIASAYRVMADQRFVAIYGLRDSRMSQSTIPAFQCTLWKIRVGNSDKVIWDASKCYAYRSEAVGICTSAVIIPQNTQYNIYGYLPTAAGNAVSWVALEGFVVERRGNVVSP
jgi:hypothetical protein